MVAFTRIVGGVIAGYLTVLIGVLCDLGCTSLGTDSREGDLTPDQPDPYAGLAPEKPPQAPFRRSAV